MRCKGLVEIRRTRACDGVRGELMALGWLMMERGECNGGEGKLCDGEGRTTYDGEMKREREKKYIYKENV